MCVLKTRETPGMLPGDKAVTLLQPRTDTPFVLAKPWIAVPDKTESCTDSAVNFLRATLQPASLT